MPILTLGYYLFLVSAILFASRALGYIKESKLYREEKKEAEKKDLYKVIENQSKAWHYGKVAFILLFLAHLINRISYLVK